MNYLYSRSHFSQLPQAVSKKPIYCLSQKFSHISKIIDPFINVFSPNEVRNHFRVCDQSIVTFGIIGLCLGFSNIYHVDSLHRFRKSVVDKVKIDVSFFLDHSKENNIKIQYSNETVQNMGMDDPTICVYQFICNENDNGDTNII